MTRAFKGLMVALGRPSEQKGDGEMSVHIFKPFHKNISEIRVGWDPPFQQFFLTVFGEPENDGGERIIFDSWFLSVENVVAEAKKWTEIPKNLAENLTQDTKLIYPESNRIINYNRP